MNPFLPLTETEQTNIVSYFKENIIKDQEVPFKVMFNYVGLKEPNKKLVLLWRENGILPKRLAEVHLYYYGIDKYYVYVVDLINEQVNTISEPKLIPGARSQYNCPDDELAIQSVITNMDFRNAMKSKGLTDYEIDNYISFDVSPDGRLYNVDNKLIYYFVDKKTKFKLKTTLFNTSASKVIYETDPRPQIIYLTPFWNDGNGSSVCYYNNPISDVFVFYNRRDNSVLKVIDNGLKYPISKGNTDWERPYPNNINPLITYLPNGPSYVLNKNVVKWSDWEFTWSFDPVYGLSLYDISFLDRTTWRENPNFPPVKRSIIYKANITELITSYAAKEQVTAPRQFFDLGEYPARDFCVPQIKGIDVPEYADLFGVIVTNVDGTVFELADAIALYEQNDNMLWRHTDYPCDGNTVTRGRAGRKLTLTCTHTIGNYDYTFNWNFLQDGKINLQVIPSGCLSCVPSEITYLNDNDIEIESGTLVRPNIIASNHSHIINIRIDFMIDGLVNSVKEVELYNPCDNNENPYGNVFTEKETLLRTELESIRNQNFDKSRNWVVCNHDSKNYVGSERGYKIIPYPRSASLYNKNERTVVRAPFILNDFFVTKFRENELYGAGRYVVESEKPQGTPIYCKNNENIVNEDVVVWYSLGFAHKPDIEQYPVMPREILELNLEPENFFNENPALYIPPTAL